MSIYKSFSLEGRPGSTEFIQGADTTDAWRWAQEETTTFHLQGTLDNYRDFLIKILEENSWTPPSTEMPIQLKGLQERVILCILYLHFANKKLSSDVTVN